MKKVLKIASDVFFGVVVVAAIAMMVFTIVSVTTFNRSDRTFFGYRAYIVLSNSMQATDFEAGDLVLVKEVQPQTLQPGDIIAFTSQSTESFGEVVTHKIRKLTVTEDGEPAFITYGTTTNTDDEIPVEYPFVLGKYSFKLPKVGTFFQFLKTPQGYILFILVPFMALIIYQIVRSVVLFNQYKRLQLKKLKAQRAKLEKEREEARQMQEELAALKQQLAEKDKS